MSETASPHVALAKSTTDRAAKSSATRDSATKDGVPDSGPPGNDSTKNGPAESCATSGALLPSLAPLLREWLPRQRWFAGKGQPVTGFSLLSATEMLPVDSGSTGPGLLHLLVRVQQPALSARTADDCYQLLLGVRASLPPRLAPALIGRVTQGPLAGRTVYDGLHDPRLAGLLLERFRCPGVLGPLRFDRTAPIPPGLTPGCWTPSSPTPRSSTATRTSSRSSAGSSPARTRIWSCRSRSPARGADGCPPRSPGSRPPPPSRSPSVCSSPSCTAPGTAGSSPWARWPRAATSSPRRGHWAGPPPRCTPRSPPPCRHPRWAGRRPGTSSPG